MTIKSLLVPMLTHHNSNGGLLAYETVMYRTVTYFGMIAGIMAFFKTKNCILIYMEIVS